MKKITLALSIVCLFTMFLTLSAAETSLWGTDYNKATVQAKAENKPLLINFTGSDWCGFCIILDREVFSQKPFLEFAKKNLVLLKVDFPRKKDQSKKLKEQNSELAKKFQVRGFPTIYLMSPEGEVLAEMSGYRRGKSADYLERLKDAVSKYEKSEKVR